MVDIDLRQFPDKYMVVSSAKSRLFESDKHSEIDQELIDIGINARILVGIDLHCSIACCNTVSRGIGESATDQWAPLQR